MSRFNIHRSIRCRIVTETVAAVVVTRKTITRLAQNHRHSYCIISLPRVSIYAYIYYCVRMCACIYNNNNSPRVCAARGAFCVKFYVFSTRGMRLINPPTSERCRYSVCRMEYQMNRHCGRRAVITTGETRA